MANRAYVTLLLVLFIVLCAMIYRYSEGLFPTWTSLSPTSSSEQTSPITAKEGWKIYENTEFGLGFQYPQEWTVYEDRDLNPYNKFEVGATPDMRQYFRPFYVLVSKREHGDRLTNNARESGRDIKDISVGGKPAIRYEYYLEDIHRTTIIIPFSAERSFIIGNERNENVPEFEQILGSFRFL